MSWLSIGIVTQGKEGFKASSKWRSEGGALGAPLRQCYQETMPKKRKIPLIGARRKRYWRKRDVQPPSTTEEIKIKEETNSAEIVIHHDVKPAIQESDWFWAIPSLVLCASNETPNHVEADIVENKKDSDGAEAHQFILILHCVYEYEPSRNVDAIAEALKPAFLQKLYTELKATELPSTWTLVHRKPEFVSIVEISSWMPSVIQKNVTIDADRNVRLYIHNKRLVIDKHSNWLKSSCSLQISQTISFSIEQILRLLRRMSSASVCCGNFEKNCLSIYEEGIVEKVRNNSYMEGDYQQVTCDGVAYSKTVRSNNCHLILQRNNLRCYECSKIRQAMNLTAYKKKLLVPPEKFVGSSSTIPFRHLTSDQKTRRMQNLSNALKSEKNITFKLKQISAKHAQRSATLSQELQQMMDGISTEEDHMCS